MTARPVYDMLPAERRGAVLSLAVFDDPDTVLVIAQARLVPSLLPPAGTGHDFGCFEARLSESRSFATAPASQRDVARLLLWLQACAHPEVSPIVSADAAPHVCSLIESVASNFPEFILAPGTWNFPPKGFACGGTLVEALLYANVRIERGWLSAPVFDSLVQQAAMYRRFTAPAAVRTLADAIAARQLYSAAAWMCASPVFTADFAELLTDREGSPIGGLVKGCVWERYDYLFTAEPERPRAARAVLSAVAARHPGLLRCHPAGPAGLADDRPAVLIARIADGWIRAARGWSAQIEDLAEVARDVGALIGLAEHETFSQLASCLATERDPDGPALSVLSIRGLTPLLQELAAAGVRPEMPVRFRARASNHFGEAPVPERLGDALAVQFGHDQVQPFNSFCMERDMKDTIEQAGALRAEPAAARCRPSARASV